MRVKRTLVRGARLIRNCRTIFGVSSCKYDAVKSSYNQLVTCLLFKYACLESLKLFSKTASSPSPSRLSLSGLGASPHHASRGCLPSFWPVELQVQVHSRKVTHISLVNIEAAAVEVMRHPFGMNRFWNDRDALLSRPSQ